MYRKEAGKCKAAIIEHIPAKRFIMLAVVLDTAACRYYYGFSASGCLTRMPQTDHFIIWDLAWTLIGPLVIFFFQRANIF